MARDYVFAPEEYYHIYNRGVEKRKIFLNKKDYERFLFLLFICNNSSSVEIRNYGGLTSVEKFKLKRETTLVDIGAYCLMPNHFHLLLKEKTEGGISLFMQKLMTAYTMYFNKVYKRSGVLFQGSFKARHIEEDKYLEYLYAYIHLKPIKLIEPNWKEKIVKNNEKVKEFLSSYIYSSYLDFTGIDRAEGSILNNSVFPDYFQNEVSFKEFVNSWLNNIEFVEDTEV